jgi:hypothetical protein
MARTRCGLVVNAVPGGTAALAHRAASSHQDAGRYSRASINARPVRGCVGQEHSDLAVFDAPGGARVLSLRSDRPDPLLQEPGLVDHEHRLRMIEARRDQITQVLGGTIVVPHCGTQQPLHSVRAGMASVFGQPPPVFPADHQMIASIVSRVLELAGQPGANAELA